MADVDVTPDGDPIDVRTYWLPLPDGSERPVTLDLTKLNAAVARFQDAVERLRPRKDTTRDD